jgi:hypothetical protein
MLNYVSHFFLCLIKALGLKTGDELPPVLPIVSYSGEGTYPRRGSMDWYTPALEVLDLIEVVPQGLEACQPKMRYHLIDEMRWPCAAFVGVKNALGLFLRLQQSDPDEVRQLILEEEALDWLEREQPELLRDLLEWMGLVLLPRQTNTTAQKLKTLDEMKNLHGDRYANLGRDGTGQGPQRRTDRGPHRRINRGRDSGASQGGS